MTCTIAISLVILVASVSGLVFLVMKMCRTGESLVSDKANYGGDYYSQQGGH